MVAILGDKNKLLTHALKFRHGYCNGSLSKNAWYIDAYTLVSPFDEILISNVGSTSDVVDTIRFNQFTPGHGTNGREREREKRERRKRVSVDVNDLSVPS